MKSPNEVSRDTFLHCVDTMPFPTDAPILKLRHSEKSIRRWHEAVRRLAQTKRPHHPARLVQNRPHPPPSADATTLALREARCEIQAINISNPVRLALGSDVIAVQSVGGYKERDPIHEIFKLGQTNEMDRTQLDKE